MNLAGDKAAARKAAFVRRAAAHDAHGPGRAGHLSQVLAGYRGVPLSGYWPIRTEIDPRAAMEEAAAHGPVGLPVIQGPNQPLRFARWEPDCPMIPGPFGAMVPEAQDFIVPEILIVPLVAFTRQGARLGYGGGFYDRTLEMLRSERATLAVGFAYAAQEADSLPIEDTDQLLDMIVTEREVISPRAG